MFQRSATRDDRRRRLFRDDAPLAEGGASRLRAAPRCSSEALVDGAIPQLRLVDLVPRRPWALFGLLAVGGLVIAGLELLYFWMLSLAELTTDGSIAAFDLDREGSLGAWWSTTLLTIAALAAWLVYLMRRARADDYQARYRVWLWAAAVWFLMGVDEAASLHEGFKEMLVHLTGLRVLGDGSVWWMAAYVLLLVPLGLRLLLDLRGSRLALSFLALSGASFVLAAVAQLEWLPELSIPAMTMIEEGAEMTGDLFLAGAMLAHARFLMVGGDAATVSRKARRRKAAVEAQDRDEAPDTASDERPRSPVPSAAPLRRADPPSVVAQGPHRMSKSERKALRRQARAERDDWN